MENVQSEEGSSNKEVVAANTANSSDGSSERANSEEEKNEIAYQKIGQTVKVNDSDGNKVRNAQYFTLKVECGRGIASTTGSGTYLKGSKITLGATASENNAFIGGIIPLYELPENTTSEIDDLTKTNAIITLNENTSINALADWNPFRTYDGSWEYVELILRDTLPSDKLPDGINIPHDNDGHFNLEGTDISTPGESDTVLKDIMKRNIKMLRIALPPDGIYKSMEKYTTQRILFKRERVGRWNTDPYPNTRRTSGERDQIAHKAATNIPGN